MVTNENYTAVDGYGSSTYTTLPDQTVSTKKKLTDRKWQERTIEYYIHNSYAVKNTRRKSFDEMRHNRAVVNAVMDLRSLQEGLDPVAVIEDSSNVDFPYTFYNIIEQPLMTLLGEELKRPYDIKAFAINPDAVNEKDRLFKVRLREYLESVAQRQDLTDELLQEELERLDRWKKEDLQSAHEKMANEILQCHLHDPEIDLKGKFNAGWQDLQVIAEEVFRIGREGKDPKVYHVDCEHFAVHGLGQSCHIEDGVAWVEIQWKSINSIIQEFSEDLTEDDVKTLFATRYSQPAVLVPTPVVSNVEVTRNNLPEVSEYVSVDTGIDFAYFDKGPLSDSRWYDDFGNVRVIRVQFLSLKRVGYLETFDIETGQPIYTFVDETYKVDKSRGESIKWVFVDELWEGVKIGNNLYKRIKPADIQIRSLNNPAKVKPLYVGIIRAYAGSTARSRLDAALPYQNNYNIWSNKLQELWTKNLGKVAIIDGSKIPSDMSTDEWLVWLKRFGLVFENPFEEHKKRPEILAGNMQQGNRVMDLSLATEINQAISWLQYIEQMINKVMAVPEPRQGDLTGNEGLGTSQQAIISSNSQTEPDFAMHEYVRAKVMEVLLEYTKFLWKDDNGKRQYLLDDLSNYILDIDGAVLAEAEFGVRITNTGKAAEMGMVLKNLIHPAMQSGTATLSDAAKAMLADTPTRMLRLLEASEDKRIKQQQEAEKMRQESQQQALEMQAQLEEQKHAREMEKLAFERETELMKLQLQLQSKAISEDTKYAVEASKDDNKDGVDDQVELDKQKLANDIKEKELGSKEKIEKMKLEAQRDMLREQLKAQKEIAKYKTKKTV